MNTKSFSLLILVAIFVITGCQKWSEDTLTKSYYNGETINGLDIECPANVIVSKTETIGSMTIEFNSNLSNDIIVNKDPNGIVKVRVNRNLNVPSGKKLIIKINANINALNKLEAEGACNVTFNSQDVFKGHSCEIDVDGASSVTGLNMVLSNRLDMDISGASKFAGKVIANSYEHDISGASNVTLEIGSCDNMDVELEGASELTINSLSELENGTLKTDISGASEFYISNSKFKLGNISLSGASYAKIWITGTLNCDLSGASHLDLKGNPSMGNINVSGSSKISNY